MVFKRRWSHQGRRRGRRVFGSSKRTKRRRDSRHAQNTCTEATCAAHGACSRRPYAGKFAQLHILFSCPLSGTHRVLNKTRIDRGVCQAEVWGVVVVYLLNEEIPTDAPKFWLERENELILRYSNKHASWHGGKVRRAPLHGNLTAWRLEKELPSKADTIYVPECKISRNKAVARLEVRWHFRKIFLNIALLTLFVLGFQLQAKAGEAADILFAIPGVFAFQWLHHDRSFRSALFVYTTEPKDRANLPEKFRGMPICHVQATHRQGILFFESRVRLKDFPPPLSGEERPAGQPYIPHHTDLKEYDPLVGGIMVCIHYILE